MLDLIFTSVMVKKEAKLLKGEIKYEYIIWIYYILDLNRPFKHFVGVKS